MKTLYLDCGMGAAGDMLTAALIELTDDPDLFLDRLNAAGIPNVRYYRNAVHSFGIAGTHITVTVRGEEEDAHAHHHHHHHSSMHDIEHIVSHLNVTEPVKESILAVYRIIADAESLAHGVPVSEVHFHEVGAMDAIADVTAVCMLMEALSPDVVIASPVHVGSGNVRCAHGLLPVPAPATAHILKGIPIYSADIETELCTPTGAALLKHFVNRFGNMPAMSVHSIGYGMGKKEFDRPNCVRAMLGESMDKTDLVFELSCNIDDMTAEEIGFAAEMLLESGALDVYTIPIGMKKSRPGTMLCVLCREQDKDKMLRLIFKHTTTLGVRECAMQRSTLSRKIESINTPYGTVRKKCASGFGAERMKYEYEDLAHIAREHVMSIAEVKNHLQES